MRLREQFHLLLREKEEEEERKVGSSSSTWRNEGECFRGFFFKTSPYHKVLQCVGHALHISIPPSWEIIYWYVSFDPFLQLQFMGMFFLIDWYCFIEI